MADSGVSSSVAGEKRQKKRKRSDSEVKSSFLQEISVLEEQISRLEGEIEAEELVCSGSISCETLQEICIQLRSSKSARSERSKAKTRLQEEKYIDKLQESVEKLYLLTGIKLKENQASILSVTNNNNNIVNNNNIDNNDKQCCRTWRRKITGSCEAIEFTIKFDVEETEIEKEDGASTSSLLEDSQEPRTTATVTNLKVNLQNAFATDELRSFIQSVEQERALQTFFHGLQGYCHWYTHRQRTFRHFKSKYPENVLIPCDLEGSRTLTVVSSEDLNLMVNWTIDVSSTGHASPCIDAIVCSSISGLSEDERGEAIMHSVPAQFRQMLLALDIEQAIELLICTARS